MSGAREISLFPKADVGMVAGWTASRIRSELYC